MATVSHLPGKFRERYEIKERYYPTIFLLLPCSSALTTFAISTLMRPFVSGKPELPRILQAKVPLHPPTTASQAEHWTNKYWPCTFNPASQTIQNAPPLHHLRNITAELDNEQTDVYMKLARQVAQECDDLKVGRSVGAVLVDPVKNEVIAAAGDARWYKQDRHPESPKRSNGRPEHHALMRAIASVAKKEIRRRGGVNAEEEFESNGLDLMGQPLTATERQYFLAPEISTAAEAEATPLPAAQSGPRPDPYLCNGLDVYLTHEPCVCCAMAMLHSRFRTCIFARPMHASGALTADADGLGYGLFWRRELNWRVTTFEYLPDVDGVEAENESGPFSA
jgi:tRNA-specific adenosine deaminase 3